MKTVREKINESIIISIKPDYETSPIKKVVAEAEIIEVIGLPKEKLWKATKKHSGISKEYFDSYFDKQDIAYAYKLGKVKVYEKPKELIDFGILHAPQSYAYVVYI